jgi:hypothetical protein
VECDKRPDALFTPTPEEIEKDKNGLLPQLPLVTYNNPRWIALPVDDPLEEGDQPLPEEDDRYLCTGGAGPAGTLNEDGVSFPTPDEEREQLARAKEAMLCTNSEREAREKLRYAIASENGGIVENQPYYNGLNKEYSAKVQAILWHQGAAKQLRRYLQRGRSPGLFNEWMKILAQWEDQAQRRGCASPSYVPGYDYFIDEEIGNLEFDVATMRKMVEARGKKAEAATQQALRLPRTAAQVQDWMNKLADLWEEANGAEVQFPYNVPGYNLLNDEEQEQLTTDIQQMRELYNDCEPALSPDYASDDETPSNAPLGVPTNNGGNYSRSLGGRESDEHPDEDQKTKRLKAKFEAEADRQFLRDVDEVLGRAEAEGRQFPQGLSDWEYLSIAMQERVLWAYEKIQRQERLVARRKSRQPSPREQTPSDSDEYDESDTQSPPRHRSPSEPYEYDEELARRFDNPTPTQIQFLLQLAAQRSIAISLGIPFPEGCGDGPGEPISDAMRQYIADAARYLEQRERREN